MYSLSWQEMTGRGLRGTSSLLPSGSAAGSQERPGPKLPPLRRYRLTKYSCTQNKSFPFPNWRLATVCAWTPWGRGSASRTVHIQATPLPEPASFNSDFNPTTMAWIMMAQAVVLAATIVRSLLAGRKRRAVEKLNKQLTEMNDRIALRKLSQKSMLSDDYASMDVSIPAGTREALEHALAAPAVQHPADPLSDELLTPAERRELAAAGDVRAGAREVESPRFSRSFNFQLLASQTRKAILQLLQHGKMALQLGEYELALRAAVKAESLAKLLEDCRGERESVRLRGFALRQMGQVRESIEALEQSVALSSKLGDSEGDVDALGALGDLFSQLGNLEGAGKYYEKCLEAMRRDDEASQYRM